MAAVDPTIEVIVQIMGCQCAVTVIGDVATKHASDCWITLKRSNQIGQPEGIGRKGILCDVGHVLSLGKAGPEVACFAMAEVPLMDRLDRESWIIGEPLDGSIR